MTPDPAPTCDDAVRAGRACAGGAVVRRCRAGRAAPAALRSYRQLGSHMRDSHSPVVSGNAVYSGRKYRKFHTTTAV